MSSPRVLVVDDDSKMCELVAKGLSSRGFVVVSRASGEQALELLKHEDYDVVLTELLLGGVSGLELCEQILQRRSDICVIVMTPSPTWSARLAPSAPERTIS